MEYLRKSSAFQLGDTSGATLGGGDPAKGVLILTWTDYQNQGKH